MRMRGIDACCCTAWRSCRSTRIDDPTPERGQLLVRSIACGISASDLHFMDHPEAGADDDSGLSNYDQDVDIVMGHEYCAEVVDYGPKTQRRIPPGTRVSSLPVLSTANGQKSNWPEPANAQVDSANTSS